MTAENAATATTAQTLASASTLPLRQDDPFTVILVLKTLLIMAVLLLIVYLALRWYSRRGMAAPADTSTQALQCVRELRLSARTKVYLLKVEGEKALVTESATGITVTLLQTPLAKPHDVECSA